MGIDGVKDDITRLGNGIVRFVLDNRAFICVIVLVWVICISIFYKDITNLAAVSVLFVLFVLCKIDLCLLLLRV